VLLMRIAALVLAAGRSRRFGSGNKLLAVLEGRTVLERTVAAVSEAGFSHIAVVTGPAHAAIREILRAYPVRLVRCPDEKDGMGYSIAAGVASLGPDIDGVAILPGDMPLMTAATLRSLVDMFAAQGGKQIVHPVDQAGEQHNPVIWPRAFFADLQILAGDRGAKSLIRDAFGVRIADDSTLLDVDTAEAFAIARQVLTGKSAAV
jgi:molybdenum cofactor cytidylyltransferase